jgi:hypothetical protein
MYEVEKKLMFSYLHTLYSMERKGHCKGCERRQLQTALRRYLSVLLQGLEGNCV